MLKKLQKKFILLTTLISTIVMLLIAVAINIINYTSIMSYSDGILEILINNDFSINNGAPPDHRVPREFAFTTRFFIVHSNINDEITYIDTKHINRVSVQDAPIYVETANELGDNLGMIDAFRYIKSDTSNGNIYIFLDIEEDLLGFERYMIYSFLIVSFAVILIFILSCLFSKKAVFPIAESYEKQKRFITDVSHELKTPLAIIKADCDVIEIENGEGEWTDSIKSQIVRFNTLVEDLISLAKLDEESVSLIKEYFSLSDTISATIDEFIPAIKQANLEFTSEICKNINYNGDEVFIRKLLTILIDNAIKYSNEYLKITLNMDKNKVVFSVENSCDTIKIGKHNNWFERFYRGDESRNSDIKGFGIGLSIAKSICDKHGAKIIAESKTGKELIISIIF